jgi:hypothetical protein
MFSHLTITHVCADSMEWATETPKTLWKKATMEIEEYYDYKLDWYVFQITT